MEVLDDKTFKLLMSKLINPIHFTYISKYILGKSNSETIDILNMYIEEGIIEENKYGTGYYVVRNKKNK
jgi:hypothetical protein